MADVGSDDPENEATASVEDGTLYVDTCSGQDDSVSVGTVVEGEDNEIYVTVGDEPVNTEDAFDAQDEPIVGNVVMSTGDVTVSGDNGAAGIIVYDYESDVETSTGDVSAIGGTGEGVGVDVTVEGEAQVDEHHSHSTRSRHTEFVYIRVAENVPVHGVTAAEKPTAQWVAHTVITELNGGYQTVGIQNKAVVMNSGEFAEFDRLTLEDRMLVMMAAMGLNDTTGKLRADMSDTAKVLAETIDRRVAAMSDGERTARTEEVNTCFPPRWVTVNGATYEGVGIVLIINTNGNQFCERYVFYNDNGSWKLHQIEEGKYVIMD